jgi:hypothetical protein
MRRVLTVLASFVLVSGGAGCGDTPEVLCHDLLTLYNEVADTQLKAVDEQTATELVDSPTYKMLKARKENIKTRMDKKFNTLAKDKEMQLELKNARLDYYDECVATHKRLDHIYKRLDAMCASIPSNNDKKNLLKVRDWGLKEFVSVPGSGAGGNQQEVKWGYGLLPELPKTKKVGG